MGYWQMESEFGKKVGCFKAPLGSLGLNCHDYKICQLQKFHRYLSS